MLKIIVVIAQLIKITIIEASIHITNLAQIIGRYLLW